MGSLSGVVFVLAITAIGLASFYFLQSGKFRKKKRRSDKHKLTPSQKITYQQAQLLYKKGQHLKSARMLESIDRIRDAVSVLESGGHIKQAADLLLRIRSPHRAGFILRKHGIYVEAARCFIKAQELSQAAECMRLAGDFQNAASLFEKAKDLLGASECYMELGDHRAAANALVAAGKNQDALDQFEAFIDTDPAYAQTHLTVNEVGLLVDTLSSGQGDIRFVDFEQVQSRIIEVILQLVNDDKLVRASDIFIHVCGEIGSELINRKDLDNEQSLRLGKVFLQSGSNELAGMMFERLRDYREAGFAFEKAAEYARAAYCFERAKMKDKFLEMRIKIAESGNVDSRSKISISSPTEDMRDKSDISNPFTMTSDTSFTESKDSGDETKVLSMEALAEMNKSRNDFSFPLAFASNERLDEIRNWSSSKGSLREIDFIKDLTESEKDSLFAILVSKKYHTGDTIIEYQQEPLGLYFLTKGQVTIYRKNGQGKEVFAESLKAPASLGELWIILERKSNIYLKANNEVEILTASREDLMNLMDRKGAIAQKIYKCLSHILLDRLMNDRKIKTSNKVS